MSVERIVAEAMKVLDEGGEERLTTTLLARRLGVSQPTIYSHVESLAEIRSLVAVAGMRELSEHVRSAVLGRVASDALPEMARAYRRYVQAHPARYLLQCQGPTHVNSHAGFADAAERASEAVRAVLRSYGLPESEIPAAHQVFRAAIHGFVHLEAHNAIGPNNEHAFDMFIELFDAGLRRTTAQAS